MKIKNRDYEISFKMAKEIVEKIYQYTFCENILTSYDYYDYDNEETSYIRITEGINYNAVMRLSASNNIYSLIINTNQFINTIQVELTRNEYDELKVIFNKFNDRAKESAINELEKFLNIIEDKVNPSDLFENIVNDKITD